MAEDFNVNPYFDDFDESKQFVRILFKPGLAVQARELTQIQTIINNQQKRFGDHIFQDGSKITGGQIFYNNKVKFIAIEASFGGNPVVLSEFIGKVVTGGTSGAKGRVVHANGAELGDPPLLFVEMLTGDSVTTSSSFAAGENIGTPDGIAANVENVSFFGDASIFSIDEGVYYIDGFFVFVAAQTITLEKFSSTPTFRVGLSLVEEVITINNDQSLLDPANGSPNFQGEGADRLKVSLLLDKKSLAFTEDIDNAASEKFIELMRIEDGILRSEVKYPIYSDIMNTMARRTFDESGDYTVRPFQLSVSEDPGDDTKLNIGLEPGKAFVKGFEFETVSTETISLDKAREIQEENNRDVVSKYGNYCLVDNLAGVFDATQLVQVTLHDVNIAGITNQTDLDNSEIGTAYLRNVSFDNGTGVNLVYRLYIIDIVFSGVKTFVDVDSVWASNFSGGAQADIELTDGKDGVGNSILFATSFNLGYFKTPFETVSTLKPGAVLDTDYKTQRKYDAVSFTGGTAAISTSGTDTFFGGTGALTNTIKRTHYLAVITALSAAGGTGLGVGDVIDFTSGARSITLSGGDQLATFDIDDAAFAATVNIISTVNLNIKAEKVKTLTPQTELGLALVSGTAPLIRSDCFNIVEIRDVGNANAIVTTDFTLNTGQRDNFYDHGSFTLNAGAVVVGPFDIDYEYFAHSGSGYFSVDSYVGLNYEDIPIYSAENGDVVRLTDVLDYRARRTDSGVDFDIEAIGADMVLPNTNINMDIEFFLSKFVNINVTNDLEFQIQEGLSNINPIPPRTPQNSMTIYELRVSAFTFSTEDVSSRYIDNRRYTMQDIGSIAKRLDRIEYYTALSLMEKATSELLITDAGGNELFKNGILVDPFKDHRIGDFTNTDYRCSIDTLENKLRPEGVQEFTKLDFNVAESSNITQSNDGVAISFVEENLINQPLASKSFPLNPFSVAVWEGNMNLSPQTDQWVDTVNRPAYIDQTSNGNASMQSGAADGKGDWPLSDVNWHGRYNGWAGNWGGGRDTRQLLKQYNALNVSQNSWYGGWYGNGSGTAGLIGRNTGAISSLATQTSIGLGFLYDQVVEMAKNPVRVVEKTIGDRITDINFIPFIRAQDIDIDVTGMKPNTEVFFFFDGVDMSALVTPFGGVQGDPVYTDANGVVDAVFALPNNDTNRFRTGQRVCKFTDSSTNDDDGATTIGESQFFAQGLLQTRESNVESTRPIEAKRSDKAQNKVVTDPITRDSSTTGTKSQTVFNDPVAQVFTVDKANFPSGVYITSCELAFSTKDTDVPVCLEIRPTVNGFPHSAISVPFSHVSLNPNQVSVSDDGKLLTKFDFRVPVFLEGGEYCIVIAANSENYKIYAAELGQNVLNTTQRIVSQPYIGSMFKSQNASIWLPELDQDITFKMNRAKFDTAVTGEAIYDVDLPASDVDYDAFNVISEVLEPPKSSCDFAFKRRDKTTGVLDTAWTPMNKEVINTLKSRAVIDAVAPPTSFKVRARMTTTDDAVSPLIDEERANVLTIENIINNDITDETLATGGAATARYISRKVILRDGFDATGLKVFLNANLPSGTEIKVYARQQSGTDSSLFEERTWTEIPRIGNTADISRNDDEIIELEFEELDLSYGGFIDFKTWTVKILMLSPSTTTIPTIRDFRAIAVA